MKEDNFYDDIMPKVKLWKNRKGNRLAWMPKHPLNIGATLVLLYVSLITSFEIAYLIVKFFEKLAQVATKTLAYYKGM